MHDDTGIRKCRYQDVRPNILNHNANLDLRIPTALRNEPLQPILAFSPISYSYSHTPKFASLLEIFADVPGGWGGGDCSKLYGVNPIHE